MNKIKNYLISTFLLEEKEADIFLSVFTRMELKKNEVFVSLGKVCNKVGLIEQGLMICAYQKDGEDIIDEFAYEPGFVTNYFSFLTQSPSEKEIRCIEDTVVYVAHREGLEKIGMEYPFVESMARLINENLFLNGHERVKSFLLDNAQERYLKLIGERKDLMQRIPQYCAASYLRVKPETISRIRKKISRD
ncbi:Crp/Fnr family transcriptional regulator [Flexithrix dorotheae]|uniref:Crp/Fnr family transcriptional regulator n=1 Tax=Flexithrix dorotheae TaxID=70993 RepID=UPI0003651DC9|nr:Crp/Fnr family transcriptional regulator [Flexithrix dorotheae]